MAIALRFRPPRRAYHFRLLRDPGRYPGLVYQALSWRQITEIPDLNNEQIYLFANNHKLKDLPDLLNN